ncbi:MAG: hypothetical protein V2A69_09880 [Pseudomonadota bacterium]
MEKRALILTDFEPTPHPLRDVFKRHKIRQVTLGRFLGVPLGTLTLWLNGYAAIPPDVEKKLRLAAERLEEMS